MRSHCTVYLKTFNSEEKLSQHIKVVGEIGNFGKNVSKCMKFHTEQAGLWLKPNTASQLKPDMSQGDISNSLFHVHPPPSPSEFLGPILSLLYVLYFHVKALFRLNPHSSFALLHFYIILTSLVETLQHVVLKTILH